jgi:uncharacterized protein YdcH (DUF465 family)
MSSNDLTRKLTDEDGKTTQPMIADVFRLVEQLKQSMESRFDATDARLDQTNARLDELDSRLTRDIAGIHTRITELSDEMKNRFIQLSDKIVRDRLHAEADYQDLHRRMRELESRAS